MIKKICLSLLFVAGIFFISNNICLAESTETINDKTFIMIDGYWTDQQYSNVNVIEIKYDSTAYQDFISQNKDFEQYLSLGKNIKINYKQQNIKINETNNLLNANNNYANTNNSYYQKYAWAIVLILGSLLLSVLIIMLISKAHKQKRSRE